MRQTMSENRTEAGIQKHFPRRFDGGVPFSYHLHFFLDILNKAHKDLPFAEIKIAPHPRMRCNIHGSTQLLQESHMRPLFSLHDNDCRRTRLPAYALTCPLRNALHQDILPELLSAGDSSSLLLSFSVTLFFTAFSFTFSIICKKNRICQGISRFLYANSSGTFITAWYASFSSQLSPNRSG